MKTLRRIPDVIWQKYRKALEGQGILESQFTHFDRWIKLFRDFRKGTPSVRGFGVPASRSG